MLDSIQRIYKDEAKPLWIKVTILRNKAFGHQSTAHTIGEVFQEAKVTPNELSHAWDKSVHAFNLSSRKDTLRLLDDLKMMYED